MLGAEHPALATRLNNLAELLRATGRYEEAEPLYRRAMSITEKVLGAEHPALAKRLNNLAELLRDTGVMKKRSRFIAGRCLWAILLWEKALPDDHPSDIAREGLPTIMPYTPTMEFCWSSLGGWMRRVCIGRRRRRLGVGVGMRLAGEKKIGI